MERPNYVRLDYYFKRHVERFVKRVTETDDSMPCPLCHGEGGWREIIDPMLGGPWYTCGLCEGTGRTTKHLWGAAMNWLKKEKGGIEK